MFNKSKSVLPFVIKKACLYAGLPVFLLGVTACGQSGALYLPTNVTSTPTSDINKKSSIPASVTDFPAVSKPSQDPNDY